MSQIIFSPPDRYETSEHAWGSITWFVSKGQENAAELTVGQCIIKPDCANPRHYHPNCEEVLHVLAGTIAHTLAGKERVIMQPGDTITIPPQVVHNAQNIGDQEALVLICFSTAERQAVFVD
ncbi:MAG: cupin domain-containing protein [Caldilineaceae bacterium]